MFATEATSDKKQSPPVLESYNYAYEEGSSKITLTKDPNVAPGDTLIALCLTSNAVNWQPVADWILGISSNNSHASIAMYWRVATGTEPTTTDFIHDVNSRKSSGWYLRITGGHQTSPIDIVGAVAYYDGADTLNVLSPGPGAAQSPLSICFGLFRDRDRTLSFDSSGPYIEDDNQTDDAISIFGSHVDSDSNQLLNASGVSQITGVQFKVKNR